jgi:hypothetical protein
MDCRWSRLSWGAACTSASARSPKTQVAAEEASDVLAGAACITVVADRESDVFEQFARRPAGVQLLTRAAQDRSLADAGRLFATVDAWPEQHRETIVLPAQPGRRERTACLSFRFGAISLRRPSTADKGLAASVDQAKEIVRWYRLRWTVEH